MEKPWIQFIISERRPPAILLRAYRGLPVSTSAGATMVSRCVEEAKFLFYLPKSICRYLTEAHDLPVLTSLRYPHPEYSSPPCSDDQKSSDTSAAAVASPFSDTPSSSLTKINLSLQYAVGMGRRGPRASQSPGAPGCGTTLVPATDPRFPRLALDNGILPYNSSTPPQTSKRSNSVWSKVASLHRPWTNRVYYV